MTIKLDGVDYIYVKAEELKRYKKVVKAANWLLHLHHGVGKSGEPPTDAEWEACLGELKAELEEGTE